MNTFVPTPRANLDQFRTLVLNANAMPLSTTPLSLWPWRRAVEGVYRGTVQVVEEWDGPVIRSPSIEIAVPKVVMMNEFINPRADQIPTLSRLNCALRDQFRCGYCGKRFQVKDLTFDHVIPRAHGGLSTWDNLLMACQKCNSMKGSEPANYNGVRGEVRRGNFVPLSRPKAPTQDQLYKIGLRFIPASVRETFAGWLPNASNPKNPSRAEEKQWQDEAYWTVALDP